MVEAYVVLFLVVIGLGMLGYSVLWVRGVKNPSHGYRAGFLIGSVLILIVHAAAAYSGGVIPFVVACAWSVAWAVYQSKEKYAIPPIMPSSITHKGEASRLTVRQRRCVGFTLANIGALIFMCASVYGIRVYFG